MSQFNAEASDQLDLGDAAEVRQIANFAWQHLKAATTFRDQAISIESAASEEDISTVFVDIRSYVSATILSTAASLETFINELFLAHHGALRPLLPDFEEDFWNGIEKLKPPTKKYQRALTLLGQPLLDESAQYFRSVWALIEFRNTLIHYKPTWDPDRRRKLDLLQELQGRYTLSKFANLQNDFLTMQSMSSSCAAWAVKSFFEFIHAFDSRAKVEPEKMEGFWLLEG